MNLRPGFINLPPHSPDINIIENLWSVISERVYSTGLISNLRELELRIKEAIHYLVETKLEITTRLYDSIKSRLCEVIFRKGERIKY